MAAAWLLFLLALIGIVAGTLIGQSRMLSARLAALGGGLLFGIGLFFVVPEIAGTTGFVAASALAVSFGALFLLVNHYLTHTRRSPITPDHQHSPDHGLLAPLLFASSLHSFLDGWSVRALPAQNLAGLGVLIGLALHKIPEGLALGWISRRSTRSASQAILACSTVELPTLLGAWIEPKANRSGIAVLGIGSPALILSVVAGSFLFIGFHTVIPERKKQGVVLAFLASVALVGIVAWAESSGV